MHQRLAGSRGATVGVAQVDLRASILRFAGIGNVAARLYPRTGDTPVRLVSTPGIVGSAGSVANAVETVRPWSERSWLVMHTDGVTERWNTRDWSGIFQHDPAVVAAWVLGQHARWRDDACVLAIAGSHPAGSHPTGSHPAGSHPTGGTPGGSRTP